MNNHQDLTYLDVVRDIRQNSHFREDRTGVGSHSVFGRLARYDLTNGKLPILTTRKVFTRSFIHEMLWFMSGDTNIKYLLDNNVSIWDSWVLPETKVMRSMTVTEIDELVRKRFDMPVLKVKLVGKFPPVKGKAVDWKLGADETGEPVLTVVNKYFPMGTSSFVHELGHLEALYKTLYGKASEVMADGDVGPGVYGAQWRHWEDTRRVKPGEFERKYKDKGYTFLGELGGMEIIDRSIDQLKGVIHALRNSPDSRRILVVAFNPARVDDVGLPPCHSFFHFSTRKMTLKELLTQDNSKLEGFGAWLRQHVQMKPSGDAEIVNPESDVPQAFKKGAAKALYALREAAGLEVRMLSCLLYMRSNDIALGKVFNIAQYGLLTHMVAQCVNMKAEELIWVAGDAHLYDNHLEGTAIQLTRSPFEDVRPVVKLTPGITDIDDFTFDDIKIEGYDKYHDIIRFPVAV